MERRLAAVLAADVVGYSRLTEVDEEGTLARLRALRETQIEPKIAAHNGRIVKLMGDGMLAEFGSIVDAVRCAVELQREIALANSDVADSERIAFRIGINLGDIVAEDEDIHGDGVNVAARLETLAEAGGILISGTAFDHVKSKLDVGFEALGEQTLKNMREPVRTYRVVLDGAAVPAGPRPRPHLGVIAVALIALVALAAVAVAIWQPWSGGGPPPGKPSIAVLPFSNLSADTDQEYFADGITEDLITDLAKIPEILVTARNSVFVYKDKAVDIREVGRDLGVAYVLEGSVRRAGDQVRINAQLIDATDGNHLWADRFDGEIRDIFALQDQVTKRIVEAMSVKLEVAAKTEVTAPVNPEAMDHYWKGHYALSRLRWGMSSGGLPHEALSNLEAASRLEPDNPRFLASLGWINFFAFYSGYSPMIGIGSVAAAPALAEKSMAIEKNASAMMLQAALLFDVEKKDAEGLALGAKALEMAPSNILNVEYYGSMLLRVGRLDEAQEILERARRLDPHGLIGRPGLGLGLVYLLNGQPEKAEPLLRNLTSFGTKYQPVEQLYLIAALAAQGKDAEADAVLKDKMQRCATLRAVGGWCNAFALRNLLMFTLRFRDEKTLAPLFEGLRKAGYPEEPE